MKIRRKALLALTNDILTRAGFASNEAASIAKHLVWADAAARPTQGVWRLDTICERAGAGGIRTPCNVAISRAADSCIIVDGNDGSGHFVCEMAARAGMATADEHGVAAVGIRNSNYCGALGYYVWLMAEQGYVSMMWSNAFAKVRSHGGTKAVFGTNPMAFGVPVDSGEHVLIDFSTSASSGSAVRLAAEDREKASPAESPQGTGTDTAEQVIEPYGGPKGFALALIGEVLCGLLPTAEFSFDLGSMYGDPQTPGKNGQFMLVLDPRAFLSSERYGARIGRLVETLLTDNGETRLPGSARHAALRAAEEEGIELSESSVEKLEAACRRVGVVFSGDGEAGG